MPLQVLFLTLGIVLSVFSKVLQFKYGSIWGDIIILPAAVFFVLAILFYNKKYMRCLNDQKTQQKAILFSVYCILAVLSFQLLTMLTLGWDQPLGGIFGLPTLFFGYISFREGVSLFKKPI